MSQFILPPGQVALRGASQPWTGCPPGGQPVPRYPTPHPGYLHPRGATYPGWFILPPGAKITGQAVQGGRINCYTGISIFLARLFWKKALRYCHSPGFLQWRLVKTSTFSSISVITEDIYLKLRVVVHYQKRNPYH